jgi:DNA-binding transcriptional ArsR family regulator
MQKNQVSPPAQLNPNDLPDLKPLHLELEGTVNPHLKVRYGHQETVFRIAYRQDWTEQSLRAARNELAQHHLSQDDLANSGSSSGLIIVPYLNEDKLRWLEDEGLNGLDLCGNAVISVPDRWWVRFTGRPNRFKIERALNNPYSGKASLIGRTLMHQPRFRRLEDLAREIDARGGNVSLALVSRAIKELREDVIVDAYAGNKVYLLQPDKLLERLARAWENNSKKPRILWRGRVPTATKSFLPALFANAEQSGTRAIMTGLGSASHHSSVSMEDVVYLYADAAEPLLKNLNAQSEDRFANLEIRQAPDDAVYFNAEHQAATDQAETNQGVRWASRVQTYLEMLNSDIRMHESARPLRQRLIDEALKRREERA